MKIKISKFYNNARLLSEERVWCMEKPFFKTLVSTRILDLFPRNMCSVAFDNLKPLTQQICTRFAGEEEEFIGFSPPPISSTQQLLLGDSSFNPSHKMSIFSSSPSSLS